MFQLRLYLRSNNTSLGARRQEDQRISSEPIALSPVSLYMEFVVAVLFHRIADA